MTVVQVDCARYGYDASHYLRVIIPSKSAPKVSDAFFDSPDVTVATGVKFHVEPSLYGLENRGVQVGWGAHCSNRATRFGLESPEVTVKTGVGVNIAPEASEYVTESPEVSLTIPCQVVLDSPKGHAFHHSGRPHHLSLEGRRARFYRRKPRNPPLPPGEVIVKVL